MIVLLQGKKLWTVYLPAAITTMDVMHHRLKGFKAVMVALRNGEVHVYRDKFLINSIKTEVSLLRRKGHSHLSSFILWN